MKEITITKFKSFFPHQDLEQEQWLRAMANQGFHLKDANALGLYTFVKGEPADVAYRVDYNASWNTDDYCRLFEDAGWERASETTGWQYWRKPVVDGRVPEIHTDPQSKIDKYKQILWIMVVPVLTFIFLALVQEDIPPHLIFCLVVFVPLNTWMTIAVLKRIRAIRDAS